MRREISAKDETNTAIALLQINWARYDALHEPACWKKQKIS